MGMMTNCQLKQQSTNVYVTENMILTTIRETFLNNHLNKDQFIKLLCKKLLQSGINTLQSKSDTDVLIIKKAIEEATKYGVDVSGRIHRYSNPSYLSLEST